MAECDVCGNSTSWGEGTAYTADEFRQIVRMGFEPNERVIAMGFAAVAGWKNGLVANSTTGWLLCPVCARRAARYIPKTAGTGPAGHVLNENMTLEQLMGAPFAMPTPVPARKPAVLPSATPPVSRPAEKVLVSGKTKKCPTCGKKIAAAADTCSACGAKFEVDIEAYCPHCHKKIRTGAEGKCPDCGGETIDPRLFSALTAAGKSPSPEPQPSPAATAPSAPDAVKEAAPPPDTKKCPLCAETIKAEAIVCRFCGARFELAVQGYCPKCRAIVQPDAQDRCPQCGSGIIDRHVESKLIDAAPAAAVIPSAPPATQPIPAPAAFIPAGGKVDRPGCVTVYAILLFLTAIGSLIGGLGAMVGLMGEEGGILAGLAVMVVLGAIAVFYVVTASGLWGMKNWARIIVIVLLALGMVFYFISGLSSLFMPQSSTAGYSTNPVAAICALFIGIGIQGSILNWFSSNKYRFNR